MGVEGQSAGLEHVVDQSVEHRPPEAPEGYAPHVLLLPHRDQQQRAPVESVGRMERLGGVSSVRQCGEEEGSEVCVSVCSVSPATAARIS